MTSVTIRLTRPSEHLRRRLLDDAAGQSFTYEPVGLSRAAHREPGYRYDNCSRIVGLGDDAWQRACAALADWQVQRGAGLIVSTDGPFAAGTNVAMSAPLPVGYIDVVCRIVTVDDEPDRYGFSYGTLPNHPAAGEETFTLVRLADGRIRFDISAASRPHSILARAFRPVARQQQRSASKRYLAAIERAARPDPPQVH